MLYPLSHTPSLGKETFRNPPSEYRGAPFWAWNDLLTKEELARQIDVFKEMGLGGFHMHVRTGLKNPYMDADFLSLVQSCVEKAKDTGMLAYLYDEDRWPSGAAGGIVTKDEKYRARCLLFTNTMDGEVYSSADSRSEGGRSGKGTLLACYDVSLDAEGYLTGYRRISPEDAPTGEKWYAILEIHQPSEWYNDQTYVDTLNPEAIERFVEVTHERYKKKIGADFGKTVPSIFTDEPQFTRKKTLDRSLNEGEANVTFPWTDKVPEKYRATYGADIFDTLPELFWERADGKASLHRWRYHDLIAELFAESFADTVGGWCERNGIYLTGHMMEEPTLRSQTAALGDCMRSYRSFGLPGIDMLCNYHEFTTAKQAQSAVRQFGREGMTSELYGVTGWDADFRLYRHQGDWQAVLGVTLRVPHLSWYSMRGEAKRDYPASISFQSPWYREYAAVEDHFARVNAALTRGKAVTRVAVVHPVESYWLHYGPEDKTRNLREDLDDSFRDLTEWLLTGGVDFDFVSESLLPTLCVKGENPLKVGACTYDAVILPANETVRRSTLNILEGFVKAGGRLIVLDSLPTLVDAEASGEPASALKNAVVIPYSRGAVLDAVKPFRDVDIRNRNGTPNNGYLYTLRADGLARWFFLAHAGEPRVKAIDGGQDLTLRFTGVWTPEVWDTGSGAVRSLPAAYYEGDTLVNVKVYAYDSLLLKLTPGKAEAQPEADTAPAFTRLTVRRPEKYSLSEDNVLLLDEAFYALDDEPYSGNKEEILRLDNAVRKANGMRERGGRIVQPWVYGEQEPAHRLRMMFVFESEINLDAVLALEEADRARVRLNGKDVDNTDIGYFADIAIRKIRLPGIRKGQNLLEVEIPFGETFGAEAMYLLGAFGVDLHGENATLTALPETVEFGDLTTQGFPFYGGAVTYRFTANIRGGSLLVRTPDYAGTLVTVAVDGVKRGRIIYPPYALTVDGLPDGLHEVAITVYLHRQNTFGDLHNVDESMPWYGPNAWRTEGDGWTYGYRLTRTGLMKGPEIGIL